MTNTYDSPMNQYRKRQQEKKNEEPLDSKESILSDYTNTKLDKVTKDRITLDKIPYDERNKVAAATAGKKLRELIDILETHYKDVTQNGYFTKDLKEQEEYILGLESLIKIMEPTADNKHIQGDWSDIFDPIAERLRIENHWSEDPEFVRDHRYQLFGDGTIENRYKYTNTHILGGSIIPKINNVVFISDNFPFLKAFYKNHFQTKYQMLRKREKDEKERVKKNGKT